MAIILGIYCYISHPITSLAKGVFWLYVMRIKELIFFSLATIRLGLVNCFKVKSCTDQRFKMSIVFKFLFTCKAATTTRSKPFQTSVVKLKAQFWPYVMRIEEH